MTATAARSVRTNHRLFTHRGDTELEKREGQIDGVPAETIGSGGDDCRRGSIARDRRASFPKGANGEEKQAARQQNHGGSQARTHVPWEK
jgi:hypothetical protein